VATIATAIVAVQVGLRLLYARMEFAPALFVLILAPEFYRPLRALGAAFHASMAGEEAARRIDTLLASDAGVADRRDPETTDACRAGPREAGSAVHVPPAPRIEFDRVAYAYPDRLAPAVQDVSFTITPGTTVALVGQSGAGKTTLAWLLARFAEPARGAILIDGRPLAARDPASWRAHVGWVPQRPHLFHGTVAENLRLARPGASDDDLRAAAVRAQADGFIGEMPLGYDTPIGERGERLSGGQAQRLAIARAFLKDAPVLILDEPTSQLDPEHEARVAAAVADLRRGRTCLLIAHRLTTVFDAGGIVLLSGGRVVEAGTHAALLSEGGRYARLVAGYRGAA
jgi:ABC-type multidrug transport system fused ATPase/permease subunit